VTRRSARTITTCVVVVSALTAASCAKAVDHREVSTRSGEFGASLETSTTVGTGSSTLSSGATGSSSTATKADVANQLLTKLKSDPQLLAQLTSLTPEQLSKLTGLTTEQLNSLGLTPASVSALATALVSAENGQPGSLSASGIQTLTPAVLALLTGATGELTGSTKDTLKKIDPAVLTAILSTASSVDPGVTTALGRLLAVVDPNGLGQFQGDQSALAVIAVLMSAALGKNVSLENLVNADQIDPQFKYVLSSVAGLVQSLSPQVINQINNFTEILGPNAIRAIGGALALLQRQDVADVVKKAVADPVTLASSIGAAILLIPGLAEVVAPYTFGDPQSRVAALGALFVVSLVRMDAPGVLDFLRAIGIVIPPELLPQ
jgi:hypothetical protein